MTTVSEQSVFVVQHLHVLLPQEEEDWKFIGVYRTEETAHAAVRRLAGEPGFCDFPAVVDPFADGSKEGFHVSEYVLDMDHWTEGYVTML